MQNAFISAILFFYHAGANLDTSAYPSTNIYENSDSLNSYMDSEVTYEDTDSVSNDKGLGLDGGIMPGMYEDIMTDDNDALAMVETDGGLKPLLGFPHELGISGKDFTFSFIVFNE